MKSATRAFAACFLFLTASFASADTLRERVVRQQALKAGLVPVETLVPPISQEKSAAGRLLFESQELSLDRETSCQTCHLDRFSSADGIPIGVGTGGTGEGVERVRGGGDLLPRNTLPLWGRGANGFNVFFWDGKVDASSGIVQSQFGAKMPSTDPLVVTVHLPPVEIREMISDDAVIEQFRTETVESAQRVYAEIEDRIRANSNLSAAIMRAYKISREEIRFLHVAESIANFIRDRFRIRATRFHEFVFGSGDLTPSEIAGGTIFYGRGRCAACHNGPFFSDLKFHAIPFGQFGFGKNGFGVDYGRYNVTLDPVDLYKFRTPPLYNVSKTAPYSHSGVEYDLENAIRAHTDPLGVIDMAAMDVAARAEFYRRLGQWVQEPAYAVELDDRDVAALSVFLRTLDFPDHEMQSDASNIATNSKSAE